MFFKEISNWYFHCLNKRPILTKSITSFFLVGSGDLLTQTIQKQKGIISEYNFNRTLKMASYGLLLIGPTLHLWYKFLDKTFKTTNITKRVIFINAMKQMVVDQTIFAPFSILQFLTYMGLVERHLWKDIYEKMKKELLPTLIANWMIWPLVQIINFVIIPLQFRVLFVNFIAIFWNAYLSFVQYK
ncbi:hypothetical protein ABK040_012333 [Willaertia magna]